MSKRLAVLSAAVAALSIGHAQADVLTVAQVLPPEGSVEPSTRATADAAEIYLRKVNELGGINGHTIKLVTVNASSQLDTAVQRVGATLQHDHPVALLNYYGSARTLTLIKSRLLEMHHVPVVSAVVSSTAVRQNSDPARPPASIGTLARQVCSLELRRPQSFARKDQCV